jgi:hypothetical protein
MAAIKPAKIDLDQGDDTDFHGPKTAVGRLSMRRSPQGIDLLPLI